MKISFKNIPKFQLGGVVPKWYLERYGNRTSLLGWNSNLLYNLSNQNLNVNGHRNAGNLDIAYKKNLAYIKTPGAITSDILSFYDSDGNKMSAEDFVKFYNDSAAKIRNHWSTNLTYNAHTAGEHNRLYRRMFTSRSNLDINPGSDYYNIGYQDNLQDIEGSSTWLRRMDLYENEFDFNKPDKDRLHNIKLANGTIVTVYKKANGDIGLYNNESFNDSSSGLETINSVLQQPLTITIQPEGSGTVGTGTVGTGTVGTGDGAGEGDGNGVPEGKHKFFDWKTIGEGIQKIFGNPNLLGFGRLAGTLINNERIYDEALKGINPVLKLSYHTHRQVVGDEATKQAYYRRAAQGQTRSAQAFTSDADRLMAYLFEAKRAGDELRAQGDLADNQEIRRTSDESNQHLWANTQRDTEVANYNIAALLQANAAKHNLLAQKHSAQWTSIDNYLQGIEYRTRQKQEELDSLRDKEFMLNEENYIYSPEYLSEYNLYEEARKAATDETTHILDTTNPKYIEAKKRWNAFQFLYQKDLLKRLQQYKTSGIITPLEKWTWDDSYLEGLKTGGKITRKKKDDLLYKTVRDSVEHFRKMSKLSSDALNRRGPKIEKLADHPKGRTKKYQYGGVAPFNIYKPVALGGETSVTSETSSRGSKSSSSSGSGTNSDLIKKLFELLNVEGIPSDTNLMYALVMSFLSERNAYGGMDSINTSDMATLYITMLQRIGNIKFNKLLFDAAKKAVDDKNAGSEIAIDLYGRIAVQNTKDRSIKFVTPEDFNKSENLVPLTNSDLLLQREINPNLAFDLTGIITIANNATGKAEIAKYIKENLPNMEKTVTEMYSTLDAKIIKDGLELLKNAPEGIYKLKNTNQIKLAESALNYILGVLPPLMSKFLNVQAQLTGQDPKKMIIGLISSNILALMEEGIEFDAVDIDKKYESKSDDGKLKLNAATALITGKGYNTNIELNTGSDYAVNVKARYSEFLKNSGENMGSGISMKEASQSTLEGVLDWNKATIGGSRINSAAYDYVILNSGEVVGVDLPTKPGDNNTPDFETLKQLEKLDDQLLLEGIEDIPENWLKVNEVCLRLGIPAKYNNEGKLNKYSWNRFAAFLVTTTEKALVDKNVILDMLGIADNKTRKFYESIILSKIDDKKYSLDGGLPIFGGKEELYKGTVFVPIKNNIVASAISSGLLISMQNATDLELRLLGYDDDKISTYKKNKIVL